MFWKLKYIELSDGDITNEINGIGVLFCKGGKFKFYYRKSIRTDDHKTD